LFSTLNNLQGGIVFGGGAVGGKAGRILLWVFFWFFALLLEHPPTRHGFPVVGVYKPPPPLGPKGGGGWGPLLQKPPQHTGRFFPFDPRLKLYFFPPLWIGVVVRMGALKNWTKTSPTGVMAPPLTWANRRPPTVVSGVRFFLD